MSLKYGKLSKIEISGYKSIRECNVSLGDINVLIGSNGAGKSNFISAFFMLQNILDQNLQLYVAQNGMNSLLYNGRKTTDEIRFRVSFGNNSYGFVLIPTDDNRLIFKREFFGYDNLWKYDSELIKFGELGKGHSESLWKKGVSNDINQYVQPLLAKQNWRVYHFHDTGRNAKVKQEHNISNSRQLLYDAANLAAFLYRLKKNYIKHYNEIVDTIKLVAPYFSDFILEPQEGNEEKIVLKWMQKGSEDVFNASQLSDGTLRFICLTTLLLQPQELQPATIIIDEPELGLHPYAITLFAEMAKSLSDEKQIIISTQSVELLNEFNIEDVIVVDHKANGSVFKKLSASELEIWLEEDYALGELWKKNLLGGRLT